MSGRFSKSPLAISRFPAVAHCISRSRVAGKRGNASTAGVAGAMIRGGRENDGQINDTVTLQ